MKNFTKAFKKGIFVLSMSICFQYFKGGLAMTSDCLYAIIAGASVLGFLVILFLNKRISSIQVNDAKAAKIALAIRSGAMIFCEKNIRLLVV